MRTHSRALLSSALMFVGFCVACTTDANNIDAPAPIMPNASTPTAASSSSAGSSSLTSAATASEPSQPTAGTNQAQSGSAPQQATAGMPAPSPATPDTNTTPPAAGAAAPTSMQPGLAETEMALPCDARAAAVKACATCHGETLLGGAPMPLLSYADWHKPAVTNPSMRVHELALARLRDQARPMPPGGQIDDGPRMALESWLNLGAVGVSAAAAAACATTEGTSPATDVDAFGELVPKKGETCYEFAVHASNTDAEDPTPYDVGQGEHYEQFYYDIPWPAGTIATRYGARYDNVSVLHHWLLFSTNETDAAGTHRTAPLPTVAGVDAQLLSGWAVGGGNMIAPDGVGFEMPDPGRKLMAQWHFYNSSGTKQVDRSVVQACTVPAAMRPNVATLSWLGTEDLNGNAFTFGAGMPPKQESTFGGTCTPRRRGMNNVDPINVVIFWPHMHQLGINMSATINRANGTKDTVMDEPFDFASQLNFKVDHKLYPGDSLTTTCKFNNTTDRGVPFGESSDTEMCYLFTYAWPANTLENGAESLIGANNTCW